MSELESQPLSLRRSRRFRLQPATRKSARLTESRARIAIVLAVFFLPVLVQQRMPVVAFWRFDGRSALLIAWLLALTVAIVSERQRGNEWGVTTVLLALFIVFASGLWLTVVMDTGIAAFMRGDDRGMPRACQGDPISVMIAVWDSNPPSEHLFLGWRGQENFTRGIVYANHVHPYLSRSSWINGARHLTGLRCGPPRTQASCCPSCR